MWGPQSTVVIPQNYGECLHLLTPPEHSGLWQSRIPALSPLDMNLSDLLGTAGQVSLSSPQGPGETQASQAGLRLLCRNLLPPPGTWASGAR